MAKEGAATLRTHLRRERSKSLIDRFKRELMSFTCVVCDFDFARTYGELGYGFIEAHHKIPVAKLKPGAITKLEDLAAVCANCHRMLHRSDILSIEDLRERLQKGCDSTRAAPPAEHLG
jgi:putative restriction endonuclease